MVNFIDNINNIDTPNINITQYTESNDILVDIIDINKDTAGTWWLNYTTISLFIFCVFIFSKKNGLMQSLMISSFICFMVAFSFIISGWSITIYPFFLFGMIWAVSVVIIYNGKEQNKI